MPEITDARFYNQLQQGITEIGLKASTLPLDVYLAYLELLLEWNRAYNLTAIRQPEKMLSHHLLDSLSVLPYIHGSYCLDAGTGAGLPGLILALSQPDTHWVLLDSRGKKIRFINHAILSLGIQNVEAIQYRLEHYQSEKLFSSIICRSFCSLNKFFSDSHRLLSLNGHLLAMKGAYPASEILALENCRTEVYTLQVPGIKACRTLVRLLPL